MTHKLRVTDGTEIVYLTEDDLYLLNYQMRVSGGGNEPLTESLEVGFYRSIQSVRSKIKALNRLFTQAANYGRTQTGERVYVEFDPGGTGVFYRSMLYYGMLEPTEENLGGEWGAQNLEMDMQWTRQPFWEGPLTPLPLSNTSASNDTDGITVNNVNDSNGENWVNIRGLDIEGDLPSAIKVQMYNAYASAAPADEIYMLHNVYSAPKTISHVLEAEDGTGAYVTVSTEGTPGSSSDQYATIAWATTNEVKIFTISLPSALLGSAGGGRFGIIARFNSAFAYSNMFMRVNLESSTTELTTGELSAVSPASRELYWLDTLRLPPYLSGQSAIKSVDMTLYAKRSTAGTHTIYMDYIHLSPISGEGGWKRFLSVDAGVAYQEYFVHDATEGYDYRIDTSANKIAEFSAYGGPILLVPDVDQRLYFLSSDNNGLALVEQSWTVKAWYRPRRSSF